MSSIGATHVDFSRKKKAWTLAHTFEVLPQRGKNAKFPPSGFGEKRW